MTTPNTSVPAATVSGWTALTVEIAKMRRLKTLPIVGVMVVTTLLFSGSSLFRATNQAIADDVAALPWAGALGLAVMMNALIHPVIVAIVASRQVDIENTSGGWILGSSLGRTPGIQCRTKFLVASGVIAAACTAQLGLLVVLGRLSGISVPFDWAPWLLYLLCLIAVDCALIALHILISAHWENQIVSVGVGLLGAFAGIYMMLAPSWAPPLVPWGYFTVIAAASLDPETERFVYLTPDLLPLGLFLALMATVFIVITRRMDRIER
ncbi:MAG: ABC transporter permease [Actinomycetaceae bacterium]|nr:ABC transporter permease [Actinomycetaceae bacterium]